MALGTLFAVIGLVAVVSVSLALGGGRSVLVTVDPGVAAPLVLCGQSILARGGRCGTRVKQSSAHAGSRQNAVGLGFEPDSDVLARASLRATDWVRIASRHP